MEIGTNSGVAHGDTIPIGVQTDNRGCLSRGPRCQVAGEFNRVSKARSGRPFAPNELHFQDAIGNVGQITRCGQTIGAGRGNRPRVCRERIHVVTEFSKIIRPIIIRVRLGVIVQAREPAARRPHEVRRGHGVNDFQSWAQRI